MTIPAAIASTIFMSYIASITAFLGAQSWATIGASLRSRRYSSIAICGTTKSLVSTCTTADHHNKK